MRIATFNLKDFFLPRNPAEHAIVEAHTANVVASLRRANADVVALQELGEPAMLEPILKQLGYGPPVVGTPDKRGIRCAILSRLPILWSQVHTPSLLPFPSFVEGDPEPFPARIPLRRGVVHVRVDAGGALGEIDVITAHFKSNRGVPFRNSTGEEIVDVSARGAGEAAMRSLVQRAAEALFVRTIVDDVLVALPNHAVCVLGDMNDLIDSLTVRLVRGFAAGGRLHACAERVDSVNRWSCYHGANRTLIDHILVSERLYGALTHCEYFNENLHDSGVYLKDPPRTAESDHALGVATFTI